MSKKKTTADPMRRLALLWGSQTEAGRSGLTVKMIVEAAIAIADAQGVDALSMRNVADKLNVGTMSLYTHIPGKEELLDLMLDTVCGQLYQNVDEPSRQVGDWHEAIRFIARRNWELYLAHPWMLQVISPRPVIGPHVSLKYEAELRPLDQLGLSDIEMDATLTLVLTHVEGCARVRIAAAKTQQDSGQTDAEWWVTEAPLLEKVIDASLFPISRRVGEAVGQAFQSASNPEHVFQFGLDRILAGIDALIVAKNG